MIEYEHVEHYQGDLDWQLRFTVLDVILEQQVEGSHQHVDPGLGVGQGCRPGNHDHHQHGHPHALEVDSYNLRAILRSFVIDLHVYSLLGHPPLGEGPKGITQRAMEPMH